MTDPPEISLGITGDGWTASGGGVTGSGTTLEAALRALAQTLIVKREVDEEGRCVMCGHKDVEYRHNLNKSLGNLLRRLHSSGGLAKITEIGKTNTEYATMSKLQSWGFVTPHLTTATARKRGWWELTPAGKSFVEGATLAHSHAVVRGRKFVRFEGPLVSFASLGADILYYGDYADQARDGLEPLPPP